MRARYGYTEGLCHFAIAGISGAGKSSLINAFRGIANNAAGAARTGVNETTASFMRYPDPNNGRCVWYDIPGAGTLNVSDWQYFKDQGLYIFDAIIVLFADRLTNTDVTILKTCKACSIPTFIVRSKSDQYIRNIRRDDGYETDEDGRSTAFRRAEAEAREKFINGTRATVKDNLERAGLRSQPVYIVSKTVRCHQIQRMDFG